MQIPGTDTAWGYYTGVPRLPRNNSGIQAEIRVILRSLLLPMEFLEAGGRKVWGWRTLCPCGRWLFIPVLLPPVSGKGSGCLKKSAFGLRASRHSSKPSAAAGCRTDSPTSLYPSRTVQLRGGPRTFLGLRSTNQGIYNVPSGLWTVQVDPRFWTCVSSCI